MDFYPLGTNPLYTQDPNVVIIEQINGLVQDCSISIANAMEILQSCTKPLRCLRPWWDWAISRHSADSKIIQLLLEFSLGNSKVYYIFTYQINFFKILNIIF